MSVMRLDKSYNFVDKVEVIDQLRTALDDAGVTYAYACNKSGVCRSTLKNWFSGKTIRPQFPTLNAVGRVVGMELAWVRAKR